MRVFLTGATGALGKSVVPLLRRAGHEVRAVARDEAKAAWLRGEGAEPVRVDLFDPGGLERAVAGCEAVAHFATSIPAGLAATRPSGWAMNNRLRGEATALLVKAAESAGATVFLKDSICFLYEDGGDRVLDETAPVVGGVLFDATYAGERDTLSFGTAGRRGVVLRFGLFYGPNARMVDELLTLARLGRTLIAGRPDAYQPSIHLDDAAAAVLAALEAPTGIYNVSEETLMKHDYLDAFAAPFGLRRAPRPTPAWMLRLLAGADFRYLANSQRVSSDKLRAATSWRPRYRNAREGWLAVAQARETQSA